jgi:hypothetical protein
MLVTSKLLNARGEANANAADTLLDPFRIPPPAQEPNSKRLGQLLF